MVNLILPEYIEELIADAIDGEISDIENMELNRLIEQNPFLFEYVQDVLLGKTYLSNFIQS